MKDPFVTLACTVDVICDHTENSASENLSSRRDPLLVISKLKLKLDHAFSNPGPAKKLVTVRMCSAYHTTMIIIRMSLSP